MTDADKLARTREVLDEEKSVPAYALDAEFAFALLDRIRAIASSPSAVSDPCPPECEGCAELPDGPSAAPVEPSESEPPVPKKWREANRAALDRLNAHGHVVEHQPPGYGIDGRCCQAGAEAYPRICPHHGHGRTPVVEHQPAQDERS